MLNQEEPVKQTWTVRRQTFPHPAAQQRLDQVYQQLLRIAPPISPQPGEQ
jgi:hypothetical protein